MNDDDIQPWVGTVWLFIAFLGVCAAYAFVGGLIYWLALLAVAILTALRHIHMDAFLVLLFYAGFVAGIYGELRSQPVIH
jgi:hypothetical protein